MDPIDYRLKKREQSVACGQSSVPKPSMEIRIKAHMATSPLFFLTIFPIEHRHKARRFFAFALNAVVGSQLMLSIPIKNQKGGGSTS